MICSDGALGSWGAALIEPYSDKPNEYGIMRTPEEVWPGLIDEFVKNVSTICAISCNIDAAITDQLVGFRVSIGLANGKLDM